MAMKIRLARGGSKKRPHYAIVASDSRMPRDGRFLEKLGIYNPLLPKDSEDRVKIDLERVQYWLSHGAQPTDQCRRNRRAAPVDDKENLHAGGAPGAAGGGGGGGDTDAMPGGPCGLNFSVMPRRMSSPC